MKLHRFGFVRFSVLGTLFMSAAFLPSTHAQTLAQRVARGFIYPEPLVYIGPAPNDAENQALLDALQQTAVTAAFDDFSPLETFLSKYPASPWALSLEDQLARAYHDRGRDTLALGHWEAVWESAKAVPSGPGKAVADDALARLC